MSDHASDVSAFPLESVLDAAGLTAALRGVGAEESPPLAAGTRLGDVTIVRLIASGGMGRVYEGLQGMPCRSVAVKVIRPGMVSPTAIRRFEAEVQILGRLTHPAIARIYSMGVETVADAAVPYFVMEYVEDAKTLTAFAADKELSIRERMAVFREVCRGVAHGHAKGVIHRDLKPGNVLVDPSGQVKVIDFGVARSTDGDINRTTMHTDVGHIVGTLCYMAPEQFTAAAAEIDVRADVYSLGVMLFELLSGRLPYDLRGRKVYEVARIVHEADARPLSAVVPGVRGDLAVIVGKCLEKDPRRRYADAADLEADVGRFLRGEPIIARPPSLADAVFRLARRHRVAATAAAGILAAAVIAFVGITVFAIRAERARAVAEREKLRADAEAETSRQRLFIANLRSLRACLDSRNVRLARQLFADNRGLVPGELPLEMRVLGAALDDALQVIDTGRGAVARLAYSPDGGLLAAATTKVTETPFRESEKIALADVQVTAPDMLAYATARVPYSLADPPTDGWMAAWRERGGRSAGAASRTDRVSARLTATLDGQRAVMQREDGRVAVVDASGAGIADLADHEGRVLATAITPTGHRVAMQGIDGTVRLWDAVGGTCFGRCGRPQEAVHSFLFSPDGSRLATVVTRSDRDESVLIFDAADGRLVGTADRTKARSASRSILAFSPDGSRLAGAAPDGRVAVWSTADASEQLAIQDHAADITAFGWTAAGTMFVTGAVNGHLHVRDAATGRLVRRLLAHDAAVLTVAFHPDGDTVASGAADGTIRIWSLTTPLPLAALPLATLPAALALSPDGRTLAVAARGSRDLEIWEVPAARRRRVVAEAGGSAARIAFSPSGKLVATTHPDREGDVVIVEVDSGATRAVLEGESQPVGELTFCPDGRRLLVSAGRGAATVWDVATATRTTRIAAAASGVIDEAAAVFVADGTMVASQRGELIDADTGDCRLRLAPRSKVTCVATNAAGTILASGMAIGAVCLHDATTGESLAWLYGHGDRVKSISFSHDGGIVASGGFDGTVRLWDVASGTARQVLRGHEGPVERVAFTPDDARIVSSSADGTTRIWETASGHELCSLPSAAEAPRAVALGPDGGIIAAATPDGAVRLWGLSNADVAAARSLTEPR